MKKIICTLLALVLVLGAFAFTAMAEGPVELVIWGGVPEENGPANLVARFNEKFDGQYHATYYRFVNDDTGNTKLETALLSGEQIDVFFSYGLDKVTSRANGGMIYDLSQIEGATDWIEATLIDGCLNYIDGKVYYVPTNAETQFIYLNKDMFDEAGLEIPTSWTLDEYLETAKKLTTDDHYGMFSFKSYGGDDTFLRVSMGLGYYYNEDGTAADFNNDKVREVVEKFYNVHTVDKSSYPYGDSLAQGLDSYAQDLILNGDVAMIESSYWFLRYFKDPENYPHDFVTAFAPMPTIGEGWNNGTLNNFISIAANCANPDVAWEFVKFWASEGYDSLYIGGKIPVVREGVDQDALIAGLLGENAEAIFDLDSFMNVFENPAPFSTQKYTVAAPEISQILSEERDSLYLGAIDVDTFLATVEERITEAIQNAN